MGWILDFFLGGPARIKMLLIGVAIGVPVLLATGFYGGWTLNGWRLGAELAQAEGARDIAIAQGDVLSDSVERCSASVDRLAAAGEQALKTSRSMLEEAKRLQASGDKTIKRLQDLMANPPKSCDEAWKRLEDEFKKARGPR